MSPKNNRIAFIVEGESFEGKIITAMKKVFFKEPVDVLKHNLITLPAAMNMYMLWKEVKDDPFIDIIELVRDSSEKSKRELNGLGRDDFSSVYLFFDFDSQQANLSSGDNPMKVLRSMIETFDNETELGKLYVSYPMAEALRDFERETCKAFSGSCYTPAGIKDYKTLSGNNNRMAQFNKYTENIWRDVINCYLARLSCLCGKNVKMSIPEAKTFSVESIFIFQTQLLSASGSTIILSAFADFILEYFTADHLESFMDGREIRMGCGSLDRR